MSEMHMKSPLRLELRPSQRNQRMLLGMAEQGDAPASLAKVDSRGVPVRSILASAGVTLIAVLLNYLMPQNAKVSGNCLDGVRRDLFASP